MGITNLEASVDQFFGGFCPEKDQTYQVAFLEIIDAYRRWYLGSYEVLTYLYICRCPDETDCSQGRYETSYCTQSDINQDTDCYLQCGYHCFFQEQPDLKDHFNRWKLFGDFQYSLKFYGYRFDDLIEQENGEFQVTICRTDPVPQGRTPAEEDEPEDPEVIQAALEPEDPEVIQAALEPEDPEVIQAV